MNTHDYCVHTIGKIVAELERCANASISVVQLYEKTGKYTPEQANEIKKSYQSTLPYAR